MNNVRNWMLGTAVLIVVFTTLLSACADDKMVAANASGVATDASQVGEDALADAAESAAGDVGRALQDARKSIE